MLEYFFNDSNSENNLQNETSLCKTMDFSNPIVIYLQLEYDDICFRK